MAFLLSFFEESNTKEPLINWLMSILEKIGHASSESLQIVMNEVNKDIQGLPRWLQDVLENVCKKALVVRNGIYSLLSTNSLNMSDIRRNRTTTDIYWLKNTLEERDYFNNVFPETIEYRMNKLLCWLSNARENAPAVQRKFSSYFTMSDSTTTETVKGITESSNKFDHSNDAVYCSIQKINAQCNVDLSTSNDQNKRRKNERIIDFKHAEWRIYRSAYDQYTIHLESSCMLISVPVSYIYNINVRMSSAQIITEDDFEYTYFNMMSYVNNAVVFWSPKIDALCGEVRLAMTSEKFAKIIGENGMIFFSTKQKASKHGTGRYRLVVVSSADFEEAMRQSDIDSVVLAYVNEFPDDIRMFIGIPVYRNGYLHSKDQEH